MVLDPNYINQNPRNSSPSTSTEPSLSSSTLPAAYIPANTNESPSEVAEHPLSTPDQTSESSAINDLGAVIKKQLFPQPAGEESKIIISGVAMIKVYFEINSKLDFERANIALRTLATILKDSDNPELQAEFISLLEHNYLKKTGDHLLVNLCPEIDVANIKEIITGPESLMGIGGDRLLSCFELMHQIETLIKNTEKAFEWRGHFQNGSSLRDPQDFLSKAFFMGQLLSDSDIEALTIAVKPESPALENWIAFDQLGYHGCSCCGQRLILETNGKEVRIQNECSRPQGVFPIQVELNVPSGKLVFANDLRNWFSFPGSYDVNSDYGIMQSTHKYAELGMAHCFCGNTCPSIFQVDDGKITISQTPSDEEWDDEAEDYKEVDEETLKKKTPNGQEVGSICTDLWWWSAVDYNEFKRRFEAEDSDFDKYLKDHCTVVDVNPGVYQITDRPMGYWENHKDECPYNYAVLERIADARDVQDFSAYLESNFDAGQILFDSIQRYPSLYLHSGKARQNSEKKISQLENSDSKEYMEYWNSLTPEAQMKSIASAADHIMCVNGNGLDWHKNGWCGGNPDLKTDSPSIAIPLFDQQLHWYDISPGFCSICRAAGMDSSYSRKADASKKSAIAEWQTKLAENFIETTPTALNKSFLELAFNICHSIVRYGIKPSKGREKEASRSIRVAAVALVRLARLYPNNVPDYCQKLFSHSPKSLGLAKSSWNAMTMARVDIKIDELLEKIRITREESDQNKKADKALIKKALSRILSKFKDKSELNIQQYVLKRVQEAFPDIAIQSFQPQPITYTTGLKIGGIVIYNDDGNLIPSVVVSIFNYQGSPAYTTKQLLIFGKERDETTKSGRAEDFISYDPKYNSKLSKAKLEWAKQLSTELSGNSTINSNHKFSLDQRVYVKVKDGQLAGIVKVQESSGNCLEYGVEFYSAGARTFIINSIPGTLLSNRLETAEVDSPLITYMSSEQGSLPSVLDPQKIEGQIRKLILESKESLSK